MASTKIINVLKDDKFEEILDLFRDTSAKEVIFVLPKTSRAFKNEGHFVILENEAKKHGKKIALLCSNLEINNLAKKYKFDVLLAKDSDDKSFITAVNQFDSKVSKVKEEEGEEEVEKERELEAKPEADSAMYDQAKSEEVLRPEGGMYDQDNEYQVVTISKTKRGLEDILKQDGRPLKITPKKEKPLSLDIIRRGIGSQPFDDIKNVWKNQEENIWTGINSRTKKSFRNFPKKFLITLGVISIILLGTIIYVSMGDAKIDITPRKQPLDIQLKISASDKFSSVDAGLNKIPGQLFNIEKSATQTFQTTGEKEVAQKARGTITVFNEYGTTPQVLISTTRFQTSEGLVFRTLKGITVPGTRVENGKIIPGIIKVEVIADKPGQLYNIPAIKFSIPAFKERGDIGRYEKIYGRSNEATKGGAIGKAKVVTDVDFSTAKQILSGQVTKDVEDSLKTQASRLKVINSSAIKFKELESTAKMDEAADSFTMTVSGSIKTVGFKEDDSKSLIKQHIDKIKGLTVIPEKLTISYDNITFDEASNTLTFMVNINGNGYDKIDIEKIKTDLSGKNEKEIRDYFKGLDGIGSAKVILSPFWVRRIPSDKEKTMIQTSY